MVQQIIQQKCQKHSFCEKAPVIKERYDHQIFHPIPAPIMHSKQRDQYYTNFPRFSLQKMINQNEKEQMKFIPTQETVEDWKHQSMRLGAKIRRKRMQEQREQGFVRQLSKKSNTRTINDDIFNDDNMSQLSDQSKLDPSFLQPKWTTNSKSLNRVNNLDRMKSQNEKLNKECAQTPVKNYFIRKHTLYKDQRSNSKLSYQESQSNQQTVEANVIKDKFKHRIHRNQLSFDKQLYRTEQNFNPYSEQKTRTYNEKLNSSYDNKRSVISQQNYVKFNIFQKTLQGFKNQVNQSLVTTGDDENKINTKQNKTKSAEPTQKRKLNNLYRLSKLTAIQNLKEKVGIDIYTRKLKHEQNMNKEQYHLLNQSLKQKSQVDLTTEQQDISFGNSDNNTQKRIASHFNKNSRNIQEANPNQVQQTYGSTFCNSDYWYFKGVELNNKNKYHQAVECYKRALEIQETHLPSIFNLACGYQKYNDYQNSSYWFQHAISVKPDWADAYYGLSICCLKLNQKQEAMDNIEKAIDLVNQFNLHYLYVKAQCHRGLKQYEKSQESYQKVMKSKDLLIEFGKMIQQKWQENKALQQDGSNKKVVKNIDFYSHFQQMGLLYYQNRGGLSVNLRQLYKDGWTSDNIDTIVKNLQKLRFFNRFDKDTLKSMISKTKFKIIKENQLLFLEENECAIVISGELYALSHQQVVDNPQVISILSKFISDKFLPQIQFQGKLLVTRRQMIKQYKTKIHGTLHIKSVKSQLLIQPILMQNYLIRQLYFQYLWDKQSQDNTQLIVQKLKQSQNFRKISEQTLYTLAYDIVEFKQYSEVKQIIVPQALNSRYNIKYGQNSQQIMKQFYTHTKEYKEIDQQVKQDQNIIQDFAPPRRNSLAQQNPEIQEEKAKKILNLMKQNNETLSNYQSKLKQINHQSDGIYILLDGQAKLVNSYDTYELKPIQQMDMFGEHRFLLNKGFDYYGDIIANYPEKKSSKTEKVGQETIQPHKNESTFMFINQSKLHLLPFYDLETIKDNLEKRNELEKLITISQKKYHAKASALGLRED